MQDSTYKPKGTPAVAPADVAGSDSKSGAAATATPNVALEGQAQPPPIVDPVSVSAQPPEINTTEVSQEQREAEALHQAMEHLILEAYSQLGKGSVDQAIQLLLEGVKTMEDGLGSTHPAVAQIYDQLALFYFFDGACAEAEQMALKSKAAVDSAFEGGEDDPAVAMCQLRLGSVLLSLGRYTEAEPLLRNAHRVLHESFSGAFEAVGEAKFYLSLLALVGARSEEQVKALDTSLMQAGRPLNHSCYAGVVGVTKGLLQMKGNQGAGIMLVRAGLREHNRQVPDCMFSWRVARILDSEMVAERWERAAWMFRQEVRLHSGIDPASEDLALLTYQFATLQYTQLGTVLRSRGELQEAQQLLEQSVDYFSKRLGPDNPVAGEAQLNLSLLNLHQMVDLERDEVKHATVFDKVLAPGKRQEDIAKMGRGLQAMVAGFGQDHMLVRKAQQDHQVVMAKLQTSQTAQ
eukprot:jgi/Astpho2/296/fgenesh1_pg.00010_%23_56_t